MGPASGSHQHVAVVGAGLIGLAAAIALRRAGHRVTLLDPGNPGAAVAGGQAAYLATAAVLPPAIPEPWTPLPAWFHGDRSTVWRLAAIPEHWRFLWRMRLATTGAARRSVSARLSQLVMDAPARWEALLGADLGSHVQRIGLIVAYADGAAFARARRRAEALAATGYPIRALNGAELRAVEPELADDLAGGLHLPEAGLMPDPIGLGRHMARLLVDAGGKMERRQVDAIGHGAPRGERTQPTGGAGSGGGPVRLFTADGVIEADRVVLAAGAPAVRLLAGEARDIPIAQERAYHLGLTFHGDAPGGGVGFALQCAIGIADTGALIVPASNGVRLSGLNEIARSVDPPAWRQTRRLLRPALRLLPRLARAVDTEAAVPWMGLRSATPDLLPVVGAVPGCPELICAFGHGRLGVTLAPITASLVKAAVEGQEEPLLRALSPARF